MSLSGLLDNLSVSDAGNAGTPAVVRPKPSIDDSDGSCEDDDHDVDHHMEHGDAASSIGSADSVPHRMSMHVPVLPGAPADMQPEDVEPALYEHRMPDGQIAKVINGEVSKVSKESTADVCMDFLTEAKDLRGKLFILAHVKLSGAATFDYEDLVKLSKQNNFADFFSMSSNNGELWIMAKSTKYARTKLNVEGYNAEVKLYGFVGGGNVAKKTV